MNENIYKREVLIEKDNCSVLIKAEQCYNGLISSIMKVDNLFYNNTETLRMIAITPIVYDGAVIFKKEEMIPFYTEMISDTKPYKESISIILDIRKGVYGGVFERDLMQNFQYTFTYDLS